MDRNCFLKFIKVTFLILYHFPVVFSPFGSPLGVCVFLVVPPRFGVEVLGQGFPPFTCIHYHSL